MDARPGPADWTAELLFAGPGELRVRCRALDRAVPPDRYAGTGNPRGRAAENLFVTRPWDDRDRAGAGGASVADQTTKLKLLLAENHSLVRERLKRLIDDQPDMQVIAEAGDGLAAVRLAQDVKPDIALVDVSMPGLDGAQVTQMITASCPRVKVIALTRHDDSSFVRRLLEAGAAGYVLKQSASTELTRAIRAVASGERYLDTAIRSTSAVPPQAPPDAPPTIPAELTTEEEQVLRLIALGHSHPEIATRLSLEVPRVLAIRAAAAAKTGVSGRVGIVRYAEARGWLQRSHSTEPTSGEPRAT